LALYSKGLFAAQASSGKSKMLGMYIHQHWPYNRPYAARTWTLEDWRGYAQGLRLLGYNTVMVWPMIEVMPDPLTPNDRASLRKHSRIIRMMHDEFGMRVLITLCPNIMAINREAAEDTYERRHFFYCDRRVNPADANAVRQMLETKRKFLEPLKEMDGVAIIDSDPAGYPGSNNEQFVGLLGQYRQMLDQLRPDIELLYWMHAGWLAYCHYYETAVFKMGTKPDFEDTLARLEKLDPKPWGIATTHLAYAEEAGLGARTIALNYGRIEEEPSFPLTNFGGKKAYDGGHTSAARGVMGNAQTHCVQLPNTFAFARGAQSLPCERSHYLGFASRLIPGHEEIIVQSWEALGGSDLEPMRRIAGVIAPLAAQGSHKTGDLRGLLFGSPQRFLNDLLLQLNYKASAEEFFSATRNGKDVRFAFGGFLDAAEAWQHQHGYQCRWRWPELQEATTQLNLPEINNAWTPEIPGEGFEKVRHSYAIAETQTVRLLEAMRTTWARMD